MGSPHSAGLALCKHVRVTGRMGEATRRGDAGEGPLSERGFLRREEETAHLD